MYLTTRRKFQISLLIASVWMIFSLWIALPWISDLSNVVGSFFAYAIILGIAILPGFMNAFMASSLAFDKRPPRKEFDTYPPVTILVAAYNEQAAIAETIQSIKNQNYPGDLTLLIVNDGSTDNTASIVSEYTNETIKLIDLKQNQGKAGALNAGLQQVKTDLVITVDGDSYLYSNAIKNIVGRYLSDPDTTAAVAGAVLVRNSRKNLVTKVQEWDYFHGIVAVKRVQSLYQGTLVAQGAFSLYRTDVLREVGGWPESVGEDIVLSWAILAKDYRIGHAEDAILFTNAPETWTQFIRQRQRWSRGLIEAFKAHSNLLFKKRMTTLFIWWNAAFPYVDLVFTFAFVPGIILAFFGIFWIAGPITLLLLPLALLLNFQMFKIHSRTFKHLNLRVRKNVLGFIVYSLFYSVILQPACVVGYFKEVLSRTKTWGTK